MKIKTIKIKVENENQEFDFSDFFTGSNTIFSTSATLVKEKEGYFWHAFITYEPKKKYFPSFMPERSLPEGYKNEVETYTEQNPPKHTRSINAVLSDLSKFLAFKNIKDVLRLRNIGRTTIESDADYFNAIIEIAQKYQ